MKDPAEKNAVSQSEGPVKKRPARYRLYDKIKVSLKTMDLIILALIVLLVLAVIAGIFLRQ
jgi:hypothetical protein